MWCWLLTLLLALSAAPTFAATYFVDFSAGSDANNGTSTATPWKTVPGIRNPGNTGYAGNGGAWGAITTSNKIACSDIILLKGDGDTYTGGGVRGQWRISPDYYSTSCTIGTPITIKIATNGEWAGSTGHFNIDGSGITTFGSLVFGEATGACRGDGLCGLISIEKVKWIYFAGLSDTQRIKIFNVQDGPGATCGVSIAGGTRGQLVPPGPFPDLIGVTVKWLDITGKIIATTIDGGGGVCMNNTMQSALTDTTIRDWRGTGFYTGGNTATNQQAWLISDVLVTENGARTVAEFPGGNPPHDSFAIQGSFSAELNSVNGDGAGGWIINSTSQDAYSNGSNFGGCTAQNRDIIVRYWNYRAIHAGRTALAASKRTGFESSGDVAACAGTGNALPDHGGWHFRSLFYNNFNENAIMPHGAGSMHIYNSLFVVPNAINISKEQGAIVEVFRGNVIDTGATVHTPFGQQNASGGSGIEGLNRFAPFASDNIIHGLSAGNTLTSFSTFCTADGGVSFPGLRPCRPWFVGQAPGVGGCQAGETCRAQPSNAQTATTYATAQGWLLNGNNRIGTGTTFDPKFTAAPATCNGGTFDTRDFGSCNFTPLDATAPTIDAGVFVLQASGAGAASTTLTVVPRDGEPYQVGPGSGLMNWTGSKRPHSSEPWTYFTPQNNWLNVTLDDTNIGQFACATCTCTNALAQLGDARRFRVVSMTATTITLDRTCTWSDGAAISNQRFSGAAPEAGGIELGSATAGTTTTSTTVATTSTIGTTSTSSTTSSTSTTSTSVTSTTGTTLIFPPGTTFQGRIVIEGRVIVE